MARLTVRLALLLSALGISACATPSLESLPAAPATLPSIVAAGGALSEKAGERLVDSRLGEQADPHVRELIESFRQFAAAPLVAGNRVGLLIDGPQTLAAMRKAVAGAKQHIHLETYIFADDEVGRAFRDLLLQRRHDGLPIRILHDGVGSLFTPAAFFDEMRSAGIEVREFRPLNPLKAPRIWKQNNRDHRKILVVDGRVAFTGGINISSAYASASSARPGPVQGIDMAWRDTHLMIEGPVAAQFQSLFLASWTAAGGVIDPAGVDYFPPLPAAGRDLVAAVATDGDDPREATIYMTYLSAVQRSTQRVWLTNAYFAPNRKLRRALIAAVKRGVDVRLMVPGFTDSSLILYASRASFLELLTGGVRIFEQRHALLHAKTAVIDGALSMVGSANLDMRSFLHNNEVNAVVVGAEFAQRLEQAFEKDMQSTTELHAVTWRKRSLLEKLKETGSSWFSYWL